MCINTAAFIYHLEVLVYVNLSLKHTEVNYFHVIQFLILLFQKIISEQVRNKTIYRSTSKKMKIKHIEKKKEKLR